MATLIDKGNDMRIPAASGHPFRSYPATHSGDTRPLIPASSGQLEASSTS